MLVKVVTARVRFAAGEAGAALESKVPRALAEKIVEQVTEGTKSSAEDNPAV